jgi:proteasome lid subunit RPN8/RPN11
MQPVRIDAMQTLQPLLGTIPTRQARRWRSPLEESAGTPRVSVFLTQRAYTRACAHAGSDLDNEVGGWLVGKWRVDRYTGKEFIVVERILPAPYVRQGSAYLTFTQDSQVAMHAELESRYPDKQVVGWYHTHPRMGIFLSQYDTWLHKYFFPQPWQVALVIEPHATTAGFFIRDEDGLLDPRAYCGFFELTGGEKRSIVNWVNLSADAEENIKEYETDE